MNAIRFAATAAFLAVTILPAAAQTNYPQKNIRLIFPFPAGNDIVARIFADKLAEAFGKPVIVDNVVGAGGNIAADRTSKAAPDGYTLAVLTSSNITINGSLYKKLPYDPVKDLVPITQIYGFSNTLAVANELPVKSVTDVVALARAQPGKLSFGHPGLGTPSHLFGEILKSMAHIDIQGVPYRGTQQMLTDLVGGQVTATFIASSSVFPFVRDGKMRGVAVTFRTRTPADLGLPTMEEAGFPGFEVLIWFGLFAPAGTPAAIIEKLNREATRILALPDIRTRLNDVGNVPLSNTPAEFAALIKAETPFWARVIKDADIKQIE